jgi:hypothetical protein
MIGPPISGMFIDVFVVIGIIVTTMDRTVPIDHIQQARETLENLLTLTSIGSP